MRTPILIVVLGCSVGLWAQDSSSSNPSPNSKTPANSAPTSSAPSNSPAQDSSSSPDSSAPSPSSAPSAAKPAQQQRNPNLEPPRSDRVNAEALEDGMSSSKDTQIDLSPPADDTKAHPGSSDVLMDEGSGSADKNQFRYWDPHKAAKDVEVGDFYFNRKNYKAAEDRYREALLYKENDATATFRLALCLEKLDRPGEAQQEYESYLKILPGGPEAKKAEKAIARLKTK
jgi:tetratricopeptide (TPR) repeat protein